MLKLFSLLLVLFMLGCSGLDTQKDKKIDKLEEKRALIDSKLLKAKEEANRQKEILLTKMQEQIERLALQKAKTQKEKEIELAKIKTQQILALSEIEQKYKLKELELRAKKEAVELENQKLIAQKEIELKKQFLIFTLIGFLVIVVIALIVLYMYKKRRDKLIAYQDNLEKYFRSKEQEAKVAIANKIIDTIASKKLSAEQEQRLLTLLKESKGAPKEIENRGDEIIEADIEDIKKS
jgi:hypothetical protein